MPDFTDDTSCVTSNPTESTRPRHRKRLGLAIFAVASLSDVLELFGAFGAGMLVWRVLPASTYETVKLMAFAAGVVLFLPGVQRINTALFGPILDRLYVARDGDDPVPHADFTD